MQWEGSDEAPTLGLEVYYLVGFYLGSPGSEAGYVEGGSLGASQGPHNCSGG